jgi:hypothetical protein
MLLTITLNGSVKFRSLEKDCKIREEIKKVRGQSPSHVTIRNWTLKIGYYELLHQKENAEDWIILLDHSIQFGQEKIFVVLGIREKEFLAIKRPLQYADMKTLLMVNKSSWNGELVAEELRKLKGTIGEIKYAVGDYGSDLRKGLSLLNIPHVHDLSHLIARTTEKLYKDDDRFTELKSKMSTMRSRFVQTDIAAIVPPKGRKKAEYQSFDKIIKWGNAALELIDNRFNDPGQIKYLQEYFDTTTLDKIKAELSWVHDYSELISELSEINLCIKAVEKKLKHNGLSQSSLEESKTILAKLKSKNGESFRQILNLKLDLQMNLLPDAGTVLFSSDILESVFGKYKNRVSDNPMASITSLMLIIAAFTCKLDYVSIEKSMENVKIEDIKKWAQENIGVSLFAKRKALLSG